MFLMLVPVPQSISWMMVKTVLESVSQPIQGPVNPAFRFLCMVLDGFFLGLAAGICTYASCRLFSPMDANVIAYLSIGLGPGCQMTTNCFIGSRVSLGMAWKPSNAFLPSCSKVISYRNAPYPLKSRSTMASPSPAFMRYPAHTGYPKSLFSFICLNGGKRALSNPRMG